MVEFTYKITDPDGIHPRPAGLLIKEISRYSSRFTMNCGDRTCDMVKLLPLVGLGAQKDDVVTVRVEGTDEEEAAKTAKKFLAEYL